MIETDTETDVEVTIDAGRGVLAEIVDRDHGHRDETTIDGTTREGRTVDETTEEMTEKMTEERDVTLVAGPQ